MQKSLRDYEQKILDELSAISDSDLPAVYQFVHFLSLGIKAQNEQQSEKTPIHLVNSKKRQDNWKHPKNRDEYPETPYFTSKEMAE